MWNGERQEDMAGWRRSGKRTAKACLFGCSTERRGYLAETVAVAPWSLRPREYRWRGLERPLLSRRRRSRQSREREKGGTGDEGPTEGGGRSWGGPMSSWLELKTTAPSLSVPPSAYVSVSFPSRAAFLHTLSLCPAPVCSLSLRQPDSWPLCTLNPSNHPAPYPTPSLAESPSPQPTTRPSSPAPNPPSYTVALADSPDSSHSQHGTIPAVLIVLQPAQC